MESVRRLLDLAPDYAVESLEGLLHRDASSDRAVMRIREMVDVEARDRRLRNAVFAPLAPLFTPPSAIDRVSVPSQMLSQLWRALKGWAPELIAEALACAEEFSPTFAAPSVYDELCRDAAEGLRRRSDPALAVVAAALDAQAVSATRLAMLIELTPLLRGAVEKLPSWLINPGGEYDAAIRVAFKEAADAGDDAGFLFMETLFAHLDEPSHILQLISVVMDRPTDRYAAASELGSFGNRLLDAIDVNIDVARRFDPRRGLEGGVAVASAVSIASQRLGEFEQHIALAKEGVWGARVAGQRRTLALAMEMRLREMEPAVTAALPAQTIRSGAKRLRGAAIVNAPPDQAAVDRALSLMALLEGCRTSAVNAGFGALRTKVVEGLDSLLEAYTQELLTLLHRGGDSDGKIIRAYLDIAAELVSLVRDPVSADLVRRRAAAA